MKFKTVTIALTMALAMSASIARAQSLITTIPLGPNQIGLVKTTQGITTRITFPEPVRDIICGDLYDSNSGKGSFVVQRIDNDVFLKPVVPKAFSNLFVKTGEKGEHTYSFDLTVVALDQAFRVVNITYSEAGHATKGQPQGENRGGEESEKRLEAARQQADDILRNARQQADSLVAQANERAAQTYSQALQRTAELDRQAVQRAQKEAERRFVRAMIQGVREVKTNDSRAVSKNINVTLDPRVLTFDEKSYLRYTIKNNGEKDFTFSAISLERSAGKNIRVIPAEVIQGKAENKIKPGETIIGIIVFDSKLVVETDKLMLYVRGEDNAEIARLNIQ